MTSTTVSAMPKELNLRIAKTLTDIMNEQRVSNKDMAERIKMSEQSVTRMKRGEADFTMTLIEKLARALNMSSREILEASLPSNVAKVPIADTLKDNYSIFRALKTVANSYLSITKETYAGCEEGKIICGTVPSLINDVCAIDTSMYLTEGSIGKGNKTEVPWVAVFFRPLTTSATRGTYIVLLYKADMTGIYLTLNQGITAFEKKIGTKEGRIEAKKIAKQMQQLIPTPEGFTKDTINLECKGHRGKGYEAACIFQRYYDFSDPLPSNAEFATHMSVLLRAYEQVIEYIGQRSGDEFLFYELAANDENTILVDSDDDDYTSDDIQAVASEESDTPAELPDYDPGVNHPEEKVPPVKKKDGKEVYPRKKSTLTMAMAREKGCGCELCERVPFISAKTLLPYYECHHIIPLSMHKRFNVSLDVPANVAVLCPEDHRMLHHGLKKDKRNALTKLYNKHIDDLRKSGIDITLDELLKMYRC